MYGKMQEHLRQTLADIREALYENTLSIRRTEAYEAAMEKMRLEAGTVYFLDRLN